MLLREDDRGVRCHLGNEDPLGGGFGWFSGCKGGLKGVFGCVLRAGWFYGVQWGRLTGGFRCGLIVTVSYMYSSSDFYLTDWLVLRGTRGRLKGVFPGYKERGVSGVQGKGCFRGTRKGVFPGYKGEV